jgi:hypothetical protein
MNGTSPSRIARARLSAAALLLALCSLPAPARAETYWVDGYELEVTLRPTRAAYVLGEPVALALNFENRADIDLELLLSGEQKGEGWPDDFDVTVEGPDGRRLPRDGDGGGGEGGPQNSYTNSFVRAVRPGPHATVRMGVILDLEGWATIERPGVYSVTVRRGLRVGPYGRRYRLFPGTTKPAVELRLRTEFTVTEGGEERTGQLVEEMGARMLECNPNSSVEAATRLAELKDGRALKYMAEAIAKCKNPSIRYTALGAFAKLDTDAAFEGLRAAASDADADFRTTAATFIAKSRHKGARALLLSLRKDPYYGVRFVVLGALEAWGTERARKLIWEMTSDEHPLVRNEALRFLQERPAPPPRR